MVSKTSSPTKGPRELFCIPRNADTPTQSGSLGRTAEAGFSRVESRSKRNIGKFIPITYVNTGDVEHQFFSSACHMFTQWSMGKMKKEPNNLVHEKRERQKDTEVGVTYREASGSSVSIFKDDGRKTVTNKRNRRKVNRGTAP